MSLGDDIEKINGSNKVTSNNNNCFADCPAGAAGKNKATGPKSGGRLLFCQFDKVWPAQEQFAKGKVMNDEQTTETVSPPRDLDELIERLAPRLAASPHEYLLAITRYDDSGFRGGPNSCDPLRASSEGRVVDSAFSLAIIDSSKGHERSSMTVILPTVNGVYINCHGANIIDRAPVGIGLVDLSRMRETLIENTVGFESIRVPSFEIAIGDAEVAKALDRVRNRHELVAIATAARKLGRPITNSPALTAAVEATVASQVDALVRTVYGPRPKSLPGADIQKTLGALAALGIDKTAAAQYCLAQLLAELKTGLKLEA